MQPGRVAEALAAHRAVSPPTARETAAYQPMVPVVTVLALGIVLDRCAPHGAVVWWCASLAALAAWWCCWRARFVHGSVACLLAAVGTAGAAWHHYEWHLFADDEVGLLARQSSQPVCLDVRARTAPRRVPAPPRSAVGGMPRGDRSRMEVDVAAVRDGAKWKPCSGRATLTVEGHLLEVAAGDTLQVFAHLMAVPHSMNPGEFDFAEHARCDRQLAVLRADYPQCVTRTRAASAWNWRQLLDAVRSRGERQLWNHLDPDQSGLAAAMFLGVREELDPDETQAFLETGTIHLLVISGLNVGILAACVLAALRIGLARRWAALGWVAVGTLVYAAVTGAQPPIVRATIMVLAACAAQACGRRALGASSLALAGLVVLVLNPAELFRVGTQLSFLSVAAIVWVNRMGPPKDDDPLTRLIRRTRPWPIRATRYLWQRSARVCLVSIAIWLLICPLVMSRFHLVSPAAIVLGPLLAIPVGLAMASGFGVLILGPLVPSWAGACGWVCGLSLAAIEHSVAVARAWPLGHAWVSGPQNWWLAGFYGAIALALAAPRLRPPRRWALTLVGVWCSVGLGSAWAGARRSGLECTFVSVGHGCSVVLRLPGGQNILYDAGRLGSAHAAARSIAATLWSRGITHLDAVVISHADADHYNALPELLQKFSVGIVYVSPVMFENPQEGTGRLAEAIAAAGVPVREIWAGDRLRTGSATTIDVLHPPRRGVLGSDNANSIVLSVGHDGRRILLTGDLEDVGLEDVLAEQPMDCDVVLAPHHGSRYSDPSGTVPLDPHTRA